VESFIKSRLCYRVTPNRRFASVLAFRARHESNYRGSVTSPQMFLEISLIPSMARELASSRDLFTR